MGIDFDDIGLALERGVLVPNYLVSRQRRVILIFGKGLLLYPRSPVHYPSNDLPL